MFFTWNIKPLYEKIIECYLLPFCLELKVCNKGQGHIQTVETYISTHIHTFWLGLSFSQVLMLVVSYILLVSSGAMATYNSGYLHFFCLLITFADSLDWDQAQHFVGPDLDPNCLTLWWYSRKIFFLKKLIWKKKNPQMTKNACKITQHAKGLAIIWFDRNTKVSAKFKWTMKASVVFKYLAEAMFTVILNICFN